MSKKAARITLTILTVLLAPFFVQGIMNVAYAQTLPFGGQITTVINCDCSKGQVIIVGPPVGGSFYINPGKSVIYAYNSIHVGAWVLGDHYPGYTGQCMKKAGKSCAPIPYIGEVAVMGTSI